MDFWKWIRYLIFVTFHSIIYELQIVFILKERGEFMGKYHKDDIVCG